MVKDFCFEKNWSGSNPQSITYLDNASEANSVEAADWKSAGTGSTPVWGTMSLAAHKNSSLMVQGFINPLHHIVETGGCRWFSARDDWLSVVFQNKDYNYSPIDWELAVEVWLTKRVARDRREVVSRRAADNHSISIEWGIGSQVLKYQKPWKALTTGR